MVGIFDATIVLLHSCSFHLSEMKGNSEFPEDEQKILPSKFLSINAAEAKTGHEIQFCQ